MFSYLMSCIILIMIKYTHCTVGKEAEVLYYYLTVTLNYSNLEIIYGTEVQFSSVAQSCPTLCDPMESQHTRPPCPSPTPGVYSNSCPSSR